MAEETKIEVPDDLNVRDRKIMDIAQAILESEDPTVVMSLNTLYIQKILERQNLSWKEPNKSCKKCYGTGWSGYVPMTAENKAKYKNQLPVACECCVVYKANDPRLSIPKRSNRQISRKQRRKLAKYESVFKKQVS